MESALPPLAFSRAAGRVRGAAARWLADEAGLSMIEYVAGGALIGAFILGVALTLFQHANSSGTYAGTRYTGCIPDTDGWTATCP